MDQLVNAATYCEMAILSFLNTEMAPIVETLSHGRYGSVYPT